MIAPILLLGGLSLLFFLLSVLIIYTLVRSWWMFNLRRPGVTVEGRITHRNTRTVGGGNRAGRVGTAYYVTYSYDYQGKTYSHEQEVDESSYSVLNEGGLVSVRYAVQHPTVALLEGPASQRAISNLKYSLIVLPFLVVVFLFVTSLTLYGLIAIFSKQ